ncbi:MAG: hypothetical protein SPI58_02175 [Candidatus Enteromonas sp.]|nr:hypothetical protein [Candidatus Enteromonas sp.]
MQTSKTLSRIRRISLFASLLCLSSCTLMPSRPHSSSSEASSVETSQPKDSSSSAVSSESTPSSESVPSQETSEDGKEATTFKFYCINDFHGSINEEAKNYEAGIESLFSFLKSEKEKDPLHTFVFSAGDMFQGSWESNSNLGLCITECMNAVPFDAMALGNHDFDYGIAAQEAIIEKAEFPILAGNIVDYKTGISWGKTDASILVERDGYKIGIIGNIGAGQTTSIQSRIVSDLRFSSPRDVIKSESARLKSLGADIVVNILHDSSSSMIANFQSDNLKDYIDGSFHGHNHMTEKAEKDGVPLVNGGYNGRAYSYFELTVDHGTVTPSNANFSYAPKDSAKDPSISSIVNRYLDDAFQAKTNEVLGTLSGGNLDKNGIARLGVKAIYEEYKDDYPELVATIENSQRATLYTGQFTYGDLYKATPFMNEIVFAKVRGGEILNQTKYSSVYVGDPIQYATLNSNDYYLVGVIDYLYFHQDENKIYNYFSSASNSSNVLGIETAFPVDVTAKYVKGTLGGSVNAADFTGKENGFNIY